MKKLPKIMKMPINISCVQGAPCWSSGPVVKISTAGNVGLILGQGTKILHALYVVWQKNKKQRNNTFPIIQIHPPFRWLFSIRRPFSICYGYCYFSVTLVTLSDSSLTLCHPMDCSTPGFPVHHQLLELTQTQVHRVSDAIQPSHPLSSPSPPARNLSQHQGLFK